MGTFIGVISIFAILICAVWLLVNLIKRKDKKRPLIWLCAGFVLFTVAIAITPESTPSNGNDITAEPSVVEQPAAIEQPPVETPPPAVPAAIEQPPVETPPPAVPAAIEQPTQPAAETQFTKATVTKVVDGDTIEVRLEDGTEERVRMIGVDTPESTTRVEPFGQEASNFTTSELSGKAIYLEKDVTDRDRFDRLLRYVWLTNPGEVSEQEIRASMFNAVLLLEGYAQVATFPPNVKYVDYFTKYQTEARNASAGLWAMPADPPPAAEPIPGKVNINTASVEELKQIIHIDDVRANEIVTLRPFSSVDDLDRVRGIGPTRLREIKEQGIAYVP